MEAAISEGAKPDELIASAKAYAGEGKGEDRAYKLGSVRWLEVGHWKKYHHPPQDPNLAQNIDDMNVKFINEGLYHLVSQSQTEALIRKGRLTVEQCRVEEIK